MKFTMKLRFYILCCRINGLSLPMSTDFIFSMREQQAAVYLNGKVGEKLSTSGGVLEKGETDHIAIKMFLHHLCSSCLAFALGLQCILSPRTCKGITKQPTIPVGRQGWRSDVQMMDTWVVTFACKTTGRRIDWSGGAKSNKSIASLTTCTNFLSKLHVRRVNIKHLHVICNLFVVAYCDLKLGSREGTQTSFRKGPSSYLRSPGCAYVWLTKIRPKYVSF